MTKATEEKKELINAKTLKLKEFLEANKIECFEMQELQDENETAVFRSRMQVKGQVLPFAILIDKSVYTLLQVQLAPAIAKNEIFLKIAEFINALNNNYRLFKFSVSADGDLLLNACLTSKDNNFDPELVNAILGETLKFLEKEYAEIMEKIWKECK